LHENLKYFLVNSWEIPVKLWKYTII